ncbi:MAG: LysR family transcriptional regulator [Succinivibrio sp.]|nr:LysR family transcriptional regulator [Succinivibrio sp.]
MSLSRTLNFVQTAEQLGISQPAVSKQLKALEDELNTTLFKRTSRSVVITAAGEEYLKSASELLRLYYSSKEQLQTFASSKKHQIRIGYADPNVLSLLEHLLSKLAAAFDADKLHPEFIHDQTDANLSRLQKSQLDLIIGMKDAKFEDSEIIFRKLNENYFKCVLPQNHPLTERLRLSQHPEEISTQNLWPYRQVLAIPPYLLKHFYSRGPRLLPVNESLDNLMCSSTAEAYALVEAGFGYAMIPDFLIRTDAKVLTVRWKESPHAPFGIYYQTLREQNPQLKFFISLIREYFAAHAD